MKRAAAFATVLSVVLVVQAGALANGEKILGSYTKGRIEFRLGGRSYVISTLDRGTLVGSGRLTLSYAGKIEHAGGQPTRISFRVVLAGVRGAGQYGSSAIADVRVSVQEGFSLAEVQGFLHDQERLEAFVRERTKEQIAVFDRQRSNCTVDLRRVNPSGIEGSMACTKMTDGKGGAGLPVSDARFSAAP